MNGGGAFCTTTTMTGTAGAAADDDDGKKKHLEMVCKIVTLGDAVAPEIGTFLPTYECSNAMDGGFRARETRAQAYDLVAGAMFCTI